MLKFQRDSDNLQEVKKEIQEAFIARGNPRAKRPLRSKERKLKEATLLASQGIPQEKASKSLRFESEATSTAASTTCTSIYSNIQPMPDISRPRIFSWSAITNHPHCLVLNALPNQHGTQMASSLICGSNKFRPGLTSTPSSNCDQVKLSVQYPCKNVNKTLYGAYQAIGKALAPGVPLRIAGVVMNCE